jgi:hypothetical protein
MMQLDGRYFLIICTESKGKVEATVIQTHMHTSQQDKITSWNHINQCKYNFQIGIQLINANMFTSLLLLVIVKLEHLFFSPLSH